MPWFQVSYRPAVLEDLLRIEKPMAQRLLEKTKWLASNVDNLRHEAVDQSLPGLAQYAVGEWRILYSIDREDQLVDVHFIGTRADLYRDRAIPKRC